MEKKWKRGAITLRDGTYWWLFLGADSGSGNSVNDSYEI